MAEQSITQLRARWQEEMSIPFAAWEGHFFQEACRQAQQAAQAWLEEADAWLLRHKPKGWRVVGLRRRTLVTRFGEVTFRRRLYRDEAGRYRFLLDEVLGLPMYQAASAEVMEAVVMLVRGVAFEQAAEILAHLTAGVLSGSTVWRLAQRVGQRVQEAEGAEVERVFGQGQLPQRQGQRVAERLYVEADGVMVRQRTGQGRTKWKELRLGVAYDDEGLERLYVQGLKKPDFWEGPAWYGARYGIGGACREWWSTAMMRPGWKGPGSCIPGWYASGMVSMWPEPHIGLRVRPWAGP